MPYFDNPRPEDRVSVHLSDAFGVSDALGNYTSPTEFFYEAAPDHETLISSLTVAIAGKDKPERKRYGGLKNSLTNGYAILFTDPTGKTALDLTDGTPIRQNGDFAKHTFILHSGLWEGKEKTTIAHFRFRPRILMMPGYKVSVTLHDDFSKLFDHTFQLQGHRLRL